MLGVGHRKLAWREDCLSKRNRRVEINGIFFCREIDCVMRDDAVFTFQLFTTDITDLRLASECNIAMFVEDSKRTGKAGSVDIIDFTDGY